jgi:ATP synthase protein I
MSSISTIRRRPDYWRLLVGQAGAIVLLVALGGIMAGQYAALSAMTGGLVCLLPNLYMVCRVSSLRGGKQATRFVSTFYRAEAGKFGLTVLLFALVFVTVPPSNPAFFFGTYVAAHFIYWLAPWLLRV